MKYNNNKNIYIFQLLENYCCLYFLFFINKVLLYVFI